MDTTFRPRDKVSRITENSNSDDFKLLKYSKSLNSKQFNSYISGKM